MSARSSSGLLWFLAIFATALVVRLVFVHQHWEYPLARSLMMDPLLHHEWAQAIARGEPFWEGAYFRAPLYPWFLGAIYRVAGPDIFTVRIVQAVVGSLSCGMLFVVGSLAFRRSVGIAAGFAGALYGTLVYFDAQLLIPVLIVFLDLVLIALLIRAHDRERRGWWLAAGVALGLSAIARPNILLLAPFLVLWRFAVARPAWRKALGQSVLLALGALLPVLPVTLRNWFAGDEFSLIATQGGVNWYIGNNEHSDGMSAVLRGDPADWWGCYDAQVERAEAAAGRELTGTEVSRYYADRTREFFAEKPGQAFGLLGKKLLYFWSHWEINNTEDIGQVTAEFTPIARFLPVNFWIVGPLGLLGLALVIGRHPGRLFPLWGFVLIYMVSVVAFFVTARYRVPVVNVLVILSAFSVHWLIATARARRWAPLGFAAVGLAAALALVSRKPPGIDDQHFQGYRTTGLQYVIDGEFERGAEMLERAVEAGQAQNYPLKAKLYFYLGFAKERQGDLDGALRAYETGAAINARFPGLRDALARVYFTQGRSAESLAILVEALEHKLEPDRLATFFRIGETLLEAGQPELVLEVIGRVRGVAGPSAELESLEERARAGL